jgi:hypothetical protein
MRTAKDLQAHELFIDGGASYRQFWEEGNGVFATVKSILTALNAGAGKDSRAQLVASLRRQAHAGQLVVSNIGVAQAQALEIMVDGKPPGEHKLIRAPDRPLKTIGPGANVEFHITTYDGMPDIYHVALNWEDPSGVPGQWESDLTLRY